jgi:hypothetical protein
MFSIKLLLTIKLFQRTEAIIPSEFYNLSLLLKLIFEPKNHKYRVFNSELRSLEHKHVKVKVN